MSAAYPTAPEETVDRVSKRPLLLTLCVKFYRHAGDIYIESQALNGLRRWQEEFGKLIVAAPLWEGPPPEGWVRLSTGSPWVDTITFGYLPAVQGRLAEVPLFLRSRHTLAAYIERAGPLCFSIGGLFNDFGALAAIIAHRKGRPYAVWTDRVESEVVMVEAVSRKGMSRIKAHVRFRLMDLLERYVISRAKLGLFHGADTYQSYATLVTDAQLVHDVHVSEADHISPRALHEKIGRSGGRPIEIVYAGRMAQMKGPLDWIRTLSEVHARGVAFRAVWYGDGPLAEEMRAAVASAGLGDVIQMPGMVSDHGTLLGHLRDADMLVFCHLTKESPRILIEALVSGTPIVGYTSPYAADLIATTGGGLLTPIGDTSALAETIERVAASETALPDLVLEASRSGAAFTEEAVFRHRSDLIKRSLMPGARGQAARA